MSMSISGANTTQATTWAGASMRTPPAQKMANLFDKIDTSGSGTISQDQFNQAFQSMNPPKDFKNAGSDQLWSQLDPNNTGSVSKQDFVNTMTQLRAQMHGKHHHHAASSADTSTQQTPAQTASQSVSSLSELGGTINLTA